MLSFELWFPFRLQKEQLLVEAEEEDEIKEVTDLRKIAAQLLQQEKHNRCVYRVCGQAWSDFHLDLCGRH